jgi:hypothetical protein
VNILTNLRVLCNIGVLSRGAQLGGGNFIYIVMSMEQST